MILTFASSVFTFYTEVFFFATRGFVGLREAPLLIMFSHNEAGTGIYLFFRILHSLCTGVCPEVFSMNDAGVSEAIEEDVPEEALEKADTAPEDISYIIFGNEHIAYTDLCSPVHTVRSELKLTRARILPVMHPCAAFLSALDLADKLLCGEENGNILYLSGCRWKSFGERYISFAMRGDGVGAAVISNTSGEFALKGTNVMNLSNSLHDICGNKKTDEKISRFNLIVKGAAFLKESLGKFGVSAEDIVRIIQPNAGFTVYNELYPHFSGVGKEKFFFDNLADGGHICDIDIFRNLKSFTEAGTLKSGDRLVLYTPDIELSYDVNYYSALIEKT